MRIRLTKPDRYGCILVMMILGWSVIPAERRRLSAIWSLNQLLHFGIKGFSRVKSRRGEIKLSHTWLNDRRFCELSEREKGILLCLMLAAARSNNRLPGDTGKLAMLAGINSVRDQDLLTLGQMDFLEWISEAEETLPKPKRLHISDELRARIILRDGARCKNCGRSEDLQVDHIEPIAVGGDPLDEMNLQTLCGRCNRRKSKRARRVL